MQDFRHPYAQISLEDLMAYSAKRLGHNIEVRGPKDFKKACDMLSAQLEVITLKVRELFAESLEKERIIKWALRDHSNKYLTAISSLDLPEKDVLKEYLSKNETVLTLVPALFIDPLLQQIYMAKNKPAHLIPLEEVFTILREHVKNMFLTYLEGAKTIMVQSEESFTKAFDKYISMSTTLESIIRVRKPNHPLPKVRDS